MKLATLALLAAALCVAGCKDHNDAPTTTTTGATDNADNTKLNVRDRSDNPTPPEQSNAKSDVDVAARIRKSIVADDTLSADAKNVKVIAESGNVVLRGPVKSAAEKSSIADKAAAVVGPDHVENDLDIVTK
jgi:osmotically-inducible protein OsmY